MTRGTQPPSEPQIDKRGFTRRAFFLRFESTARRASFHLARVVDLTYLFVRKDGVFDVFFDALIIAHGALHFGGVAAAEEVNGVFDPRGVRRVRGESFRWGDDLVTSVAAETCNVIFFTEGADVIFDGDYGVLTGETGFVTGVVSDGFECIFDGTDCLF